MVVGAAWRNRILTCIAAGLLSHGLAQAAASPVTCELLSKGPGVALQDTEVTLHSFLDELLPALQKDNFDNFQRFFHPRAQGKSKSDGRLKADQNIGGKLKAILENRYQKPWQFSIFRVWRIKSAEGNKTILDSCPESDGAKIITAYGHEKQFAVWIQIMGQNELGRLILSIASDKGRTSIVGFRVQQWTQLGDDWQTWTQKAEKSTKTLDAYFAYDIAQKLIDGQDFVIYPQQTQLIEKRDGIFSQDELVKRMNKDLGTDSIAYIGSLLAREETGILLREFISTDEPTSKLHDLCFGRGQALVKHGWLNPKQGLRCNFLVKGMDPRQDSPLGGFYFGPQDINKAQK